MKKLFSTMLAAVTALAALATDYTGTLTVTVNGESTNSESTISVVQNGNDYTLSINNFELEGLPIGNIVVTAPGSTSNGLTSIVTSQDITITAGDEGDEWLGPMLGVVPINMVLAFNNYAMTTNIDIYMAELEQTINVKFALDGELTGYQIKNSGFEYFKDNGEPYAWHGFKSASGTLASSAKGTLASSPDVRSGATGTSAVITSGSTWGIVNNGTMTTGQLNAGNISATNTANHSHMDMSSTATDQHGDPFYTVMHGRPDAIKFWLKFTQGTAQNTYKYATMSAIITDGTYYQDPEDKNYTNKLASAKNNTIETCSWSEFTVPFNYIDENINGQALLVTFSTNATPGKGSSGDQVFVDDIALVYNAAITGITIKGQALAGFSQDVYEYNFDITEGETFADSDIAATYVSSHAYLVKKVVETDEAFKIFVAVISNDLNTVKVYTINYNKPVDLGTPLAEILESGINDTEYTVADDLAVVEISNGEYYALLTNGEDWIRVEFSEDTEEAFYNDYIKGGTLKGTLHNVELNPYLVATAAPEAGDNAVDYEVATINLSESFGRLKANQVVNVFGYWNAAEDALRGYAPGNGGQGQSMTLNTAWAGNVTLVDGNYYSVCSAITLKEAWNRGMLKDYDYDFQNYVANALIAPTIPTGVESINIANRQVEAIYNAQGQRVDETATGILIIRYTDGTVTKVVKH